MKTIPVSRKGVTINVTKVTTTCKGNVYTINPINHGEPARPRKQPEDAVKRLGLHKTIGARCAMAALGWAVVVMRIVKAGYEDSQTN